MADRLPGTTALTGSEPAGGAAAMAGRLPGKAALAGSEATGGGDG
jgi:hypothetical protein